MTYFYDCVVFDLSTPEPDTLKPHQREKIDLLYGKFRGHTLTYASSVEYSPGDFVDVPFSRFDIRHMARVVQPTSDDVVKDLTLRSITIKDIIGPHSSDNT